VAAGERGFEGDGDMRRILLAISAICLASGAALADGPTSRPSDELLQHLQQQLSTVETVQADFVQVKNLSMLNHTMTIKGHFALQKPNRLMWLVREPVRYAIRIQGDEIKQWDEDTNQVQTTHLGGDPAFAAITEQIQAWFLGDYKVLAQSYDVELIGENPLSLGFVPKGDTMVAKVLKRVDLTFGKSELYIDKMVVHEASGDTTTLQYLNAELNKPIDEKTWEMPPHER
jgi:outer membrane lipoprotein-sorting protein